MRCANKIGLCVVQCESALNLSPHILIVLLGEEEEEEEEEEETETPLLVSGITPRLSVWCDRPERNTTLVARELARYKVDIAALREARFSGHDLLEMDAGYIFF
nr:unnamed protein product [Spirometra erinaceieuropaei]